MTDVNESKLGEKIDNLTKVVYEVKGAVEANDHGKAIDNLDARHRKDVADLYGLMRTHEKEYHSPKSTRANWNLIFAGLCALATVASAFIMHMKG